MTRRILIIAASALLAHAVPAPAETKGPHIDRMQKQIDEAKVKLAKAKTDLATAKTGYEKSDAAMKAATDRFNEARITVNLAQKAQGKQAAEARQADKKPEADPKLLDAQQQVTLAQASVDAARARVISGLGANPDYAAARAAADKSRAQIKLLRQSPATQPEQLTAEADRLARAEKGAAAFEDKALAADPQYTAAKAKLEAAQKSLADLKRATAGAAAKESAGPAHEARQKMIEAEKARAAAASDLTKSKAVYAGANSLVAKIETDIKKLEMQLKAMKDDSRNYDPRRDGFPPGVGR